ncbi:hypothetical protein [Pseudoalteromonas denitrificans]|jgi:hypothetical protein|uniref:LETM1-like protein n=1 Tax=Pseudoalteromonas denitrificans DSM 6059 TaxID=1123010 RepID=A0A1I1FLR1_9GAMM|nr:hypothetical protein [Pseudoalteromonas denitrificans]SFB98053.1 hypothetical protein SAMN02745724_00613 [Pseudoalteromonas denitrificans DSM 6059]
MQLFFFIHKAPIRVIKISHKRNRLRLRRTMLQLKVALAQETLETKEMLVIYKRYTQKQASSEELKVANQQFLDVLKGLGLGVFAVLPFAPITIPVIVKLGKVVGVEVLPSSFNSLNENKIKPKG